MIQSNPKKLQISILEAARSNAMCRPRSRKQPKTKMKNRRDQQQKNIAQAREEERGMLNPFKLLAIYSDLNKIEAVAKEKANMQVQVPQLVTLLVSLSATIGLPTLVMSWVHTHTGVYLAIVAAAIVLHALMPSIFAAPSAADTQATGLNKVGVILLMIGLGALCAGQLHAQTTPTPTPAGITFTGGSAAIALHHNGSWGTGNLTTESLDFMDFGKTKSQHLFIEGKELIASSAGFNVYAGGVTIQPDLTKLLAKTNVTPANLSVAFNFDGGAGIPTAGNSHIAFLAGGQVQYKATSSLSWNALQVQWLRYGSVNAPVISSGLSFIFKHN